MEDTSSSDPESFILRTSDIETNYFLSAAVVICRLNFNLSVDDMSTICPRHTVAGSKLMLFSFLAAIRIYSI